MTKGRVLIAGESWTVHSIHQKGFDSFTTTEYAEGVQWLRSALETGDWQIDYQPSHVAARNFPTSPEALADYDCVILSDIGANTLLLHPDTFFRSKVLPNRLNLLADYVRDGGGLVMVGGYMTFQGIDAKAQYAGTQVEDALPVVLQRHDDRIESPQGVQPMVAAAGHALLSGVSDAWPALLGYNRVAAKSEAKVLATVGADPLLVVGQFGAGRSVAFTSDCGPHWAPPPFVEWAGYAPLWRNIVGWAAGQL